MDFILKGIFIMLLIMLFNLSHALEINCYIKDKQIYHGLVDDVYFDNNYIVLFVYKENMAYYINGECIISLNKK